MREFLGINVGLLLLRLMMMVMMIATTGLDVVW